MKKIIITLGLFAIIGVANAQTTYKKVVKGTDTLIVVTESKMNIDTLSRKDIKSQIEKLKSDKQARVQSIKELQANIDYFNDEIDRLKILLKKTD